MKRFLLLILGCLWLCTCGVQNIRPNSPPQIQADSAILLFGMTPRWRIHLLRGAVENEVWTLPDSRTPEVNTYPESGYVIVKVRPTIPSELLGLSLVFANEAYTACQDAKVPTFALKAGAVTYAGDLDFEVADAGVRYSSSANIEKAKQFLATKYPGYVNAFESQPMVARKFKGRACGSVRMTIPIIIPVR